MAEQLHDAGNTGENQEAKEIGTIQLNARQLEIVELVKKHAPITGEQIAEMLGVSRPTIRSDLSVLVMLGLLDAKPKVGYFLGNSMEPQGKIASKLKQLKVKDVQGLPVNVKDTDTVHDAVVTMFLEDVGSLIVNDAEGHLLGMLSRKDLLKVTLGNPASAAMPVTMAMTRQPNIITVSPEDSVLDAARRMMLHQVDGLPVVVEEQGRDGRISLEAVGRITKTNITSLLIELASEL